VAAIVRLHDTTSVNGNDKQPREYAIDVGACLSACAHDGLPPVAMIARVTGLLFLFLLSCPSLVHAATPGPLSGGAAELALVAGGAGGGVSGFLLQEWPLRLHLRGELGAYGVATHGGPGLALLGGGEIGFPVRLPHAWTVGPDVGADVIGIVASQVDRCDPISGCVSPRIQPYGGLGTVWRAEAGGSLDALVAVTYTCVADTCFMAPRLRLVGTTRGAWLLGAEVLGDPLGTLSARVMFGRRFTPPHHRDQ